MMRKDTQYTKYGWTRDYVNGMIWRALTAKYKKEDREAFDLLKELGYTVTKWSGYFAVENKKTDRVLCIDEYRSGYQFLRITGRQIDIKNAIKIDFYGFLEKPKNEVAWKMKHDNLYGEKSSSVKKFDKLTSARRYVRYAEEEIISIQKQMQALEKKLQNAQKRLEREEADLLRVREEIGLAKEVA